MTQVSVRLIVIIARVVARVIARFLVANVLFK